MKIIGRLFGFKLIKDTLGFQIILEVEDGFIMGKGNRIAFTL